MRLYFLFLSIVMVPAAMGQDATEIVKTADARMRGKTSQSLITIQTVRPGWTREMKVKTWMKGTDLAMILIQSPAKERGIVYLKRRKEVWNWLPSLEKIIKLPPSMMSQSWMGTDFTNDDLVKESSIVFDYTHQLIGDTVIAERDCYQIRMLPKPEAAVVWGQLIVCIDKKDYLELHTRFYDEEGVMINSMNAYDIKKMDNRTIPTRFEMIPADKPGRKTVMIYEQVHYDRPMDDGFFTTEQMKQVNK